MRAGVVQTAGLEGFATSAKYMQAAGVELASFDEQSITLHRRPANGRGMTNGVLLSRLSYACMRRGDRIRTCGFVVPNHALSF